MTDVLFARDVDPAPYVIRTADKVLAALDDWTFEVFEDVVKFGIYGCCRSRSPRSYTIDNLDLRRDIVLRILNTVDRLADEHEAANLQTEHDDQDGDADPEVDGPTEGDGEFEFECDWTETALPSTITVGARTYSVSDDTNVVNAYGRSAETAGLYGATDHRSLVIAIDPNQAADQLRDTLLHEALHCCTNLAAIDVAPPDTEEELVARLTPPLLAMLRDNREFVDYITEDANNA